MSALKRVSRILWYEAIGFLSIIVLSWVNELSDLPHLISGVPYVPNWRESALETPIARRVTYESFITASLRNHLLPIFADASSLGAAAAPEVVESPHSNSPVVSIVSSGTIMCVVAHIPLTAALGRSRVTPNRVPFAL
jgi:hypothetical protein